MLEELALVSTVLSLTSVTSVNASTVRTVRELNTVQRLRCETATTSLEILFVDNRIRDLIVEGIWQTEYAWWPQAREQFTFRDDTTDDWCFS